MKHIALAGVMMLGHKVMADQPDLVVTAILRMIAKTTGP
jgi:hypothetical protein